jgi:hypothetical protein
LFEGVDEPDEALVSGLPGSGGAELSEEVGLRSSQPTSMLAVVS